METERIGLVGGFRAMREFRRFVKLNRRPVISADAARVRYEPLMESLARELSEEFRVEFRRAGSGPSTRGRRVFETTRWVVDGPLSRFPDWHRRVDAAVRRVADIVDPDMPTGAFAPDPPELPPPVTKRQMQARGVEGNPFGEAVDDVDVVFLSQHFSFRDRLGGDVQVTEDDRHTSLSAIASVRPD